MRARAVHSIAVIGVAALLGACHGSVPAATGVPFPMPIAATPPGITLVDVVQEAMAAPPGYLWTRLGDAQGRTVFVSEADKPGESHCTSQCAKEFPPLLAPANARPYARWSLVARDDGTQQWAYEGRPLYTFAQEAKVNDVVNTVISEELKKKGGATGREMDLSDGFKAPDGWSIARFDEVQGVKLPAGFDVKPVAVQNGLGHALVTAQGLTLYGYAGETQPSTDQACARSVVAGASCPGSFAAYAAPEGAVAVGDFAIAPSGSRQWLYRGVRLYVFSADRKPGDAAGVYDDYGPWRAMFLDLDEFPEKAQAIKAVGHDQILADANGFPLYMRSQFQDRFGGFTTYHGYTASYRMGKDMGTGGCAPECLKERRPLLASAGDQAHGYWEIYTREDGARQWAFKGFALYTYAKDTRPGIVGGGNQTDYIIGDEGPYTIAQGRGTGPPMSSSVGLYWFVARANW